MLSFLSRKRSYYKPLEYKNCFSISELINNQFESLYINDLKYYNYNNDYYNYNNNKRDVELDVIMNDYSSKNPEVNKEKINFILINNALKSEKTLFKLFSEYYIDKNAYIKEDPFRMKCDYSF